jgi:hypothetical protein
MDAGALDFWVGEWSCSWDGGHGENSVTRELEDRVVVERFHALTPEEFRGMSVAVFDRRGRWRQTWVDSTGNYWHLDGDVLGDGSVVFATPQPVDAEQLCKRMVFSNLTAGGFDWRWEVSPDGDAWRERWAIRYERRA